MSPSVRQKHQQWDNVNPDSHSTTFFGDLYPDMKRTKASSSLKLSMPVEFEIGFAYNMQNPNWNTWTPHLVMLMQIWDHGSPSCMTQGNIKTSGHHPSRYVCWMSWTPLKVEKESLGFSILPYLVVPYLIITHLWARMETEISVFKFGI